MPHDALLFFLPDHTLQNLVDRPELLIPADLLNDAPPVVLVNSKIPDNVEEVLFAHHSGDQNILGSGFVEKVFPLNQSRFKHLLYARMLRHIREFFFALLFPLVEMLRR